MIAITTLVSVLSLAAWVFAIWDHVTVSPKREEWESTNRRMWIQSHLYLDTSYYSYRDSDPNPEPKPRGLTERLGNRAFGALLALLVAPVVLIPIALAGIAVTVLFCLGVASFATLLSLGGWGTHWQSNRGLLLRLALFPTYLLAAIGVTAL